MTSIAVRYNSIDLLEAARSALTAVAIGLLLLVALWGGYVLAVALAFAALAAPSLLAVASAARWASQRVRHQAAPGWNLEAEVLEPGVEAAARVVEVRGVCALGQRLRAGQTFYFKDGSVSPELCPLPCSRLAAWLGQMATDGRPGARRLTCRDADHSIVFELRTLRKEVKAGGTLANTDSR